MNILILNGSPHRQGSTSLLVTRFTQGAQEAGHQVERVDAAFASLHPCLGCGRCQSTGACVQRDDGVDILEKLLSANMAVLATPLYYFGMAAQMKILIDRFYSVNGRIQDKRMHSALLAVGWDSDPACMEALKAHYRTLAEYLNWNDRGAVCGLGCGTPDMTAGTDYPEQAYRLGRSL